MFWVNGFEIPPRYNLLSYFFRFKLRAVHKLSFLLYCFDRFMISLTVICFLSHGAKDTGDTDQMSNCFSCSYYFFTDNIFVFNNGFNKSTYLWQKSFVLNTLIVTCYFVLISYILYVSVWILYHWPLPRRDHLDLRPLSCTLLWCCLFYCTRRSCLLSLSITM